MIERTTPEMVNRLAENQIFVFGSNLSGIHGMGAAKTALLWGAKYGQEKGLQGRTYAIPTKDATIKRTLTIEEIKPFVDDFIEYAINHQNLTFLVTKIGCGLAGLKPKEVAPLFSKAVNVSNIHLPSGFWDELMGNLYKKEDLVQLVQELKDYTAESHTILGHDERDASEFVDIFIKNNKKK